jgi:hypothetical protein
MLKKFLRSALDQSLKDTSLTSLIPLSKDKLRRVVTSNSLDRNLLEELFSHQCCAIRIPNFYPPSMLPIMRERILTSKQRTNWQVSDPQKGLENSSVESVGTPLTVATLANINIDNRKNNNNSNNSISMEEYFLSAESLTRELRFGTGSSAKLIEEEGGESLIMMMTPMDKLRLELDDSWPGGARVGRDEKSGKPLLAGCGRIMHPTSSKDQGFCHVDDIAIMKDTIGTFSANIYLETPPVGYGGELNIWPINIDSRFDFYKHSGSLSLLLTQEKFAQESLRKCLPPPVTITPKEGDLIIICAQRPHSVVGFDIGKRISMQTFIDVNGIKNNLTLES